MRKLLLHFQEFFTHFPLILGLRDLVKSCLVQFSFNLLFLYLLKPFLFFLLFLLSNSFFFLLDGGKAVRRAMLVCWCVVYQIDLTLSLGDLHVVQLEDLLLLRLGLADVLPVES